MWSQSSNNQGRRSKVRKRREWCINALQLKSAIESGQGTTGVKASYVATKPSSTFNIKWDGISLLNNLEYDKTGVWVWRAFNVRSGKVVPREKFEGVMKQPENLENLDPLLRMQLAHRRSRLWDTDISRKAPSKQISQLKTKTKIESALVKISQMTYFTRVQKMVV